MGIAMSVDRRPLNLIWRRTTLDSVLEGYFIKEVLLAELARPVRQFALEDNQRVNGGDDMLFVTLGTEFADQLRMAAEAGCRNLGVLHMGDEYGRHDRSFYAYADYVLRHYWIPEAMQPGKPLSKALWIPNGYCTGVGPVDPERTLTVEERTIEGFFAGALQEHHEQTPSLERHAMVEAVREAKLPFVLIFSTGFAKGLGRSSYAGYLGNTRFALVPGGNSPETIRLYEALEHGAIPVSLESGFISSTDALSAIGRPPIVLLDQWSSLPRVHADLARMGPARLEDLRREILDWWVRFKRHQQTRVRNTIERSFDN
jgi:hypothetical protein